MTTFNEEVLSRDVRKLPMMPIRDMVIFPHMMTPFVVGRDSSVRALEEALTGDRRIFLATQHDASVDEPSADEIYETGTIGNIVQSVKMPDGNIKVLRCDRAHGQKHTGDGAAGRDHDAARAHAV
jgi:ATP-dependent Lon protease